MSSHDAWYELPKARARDGGGSELLQGLGFGRRISFPRVRQ